MTRVTRRTFLGAGSAFILVGCTREEDRPEPQRAPSPDELLRRAVAADENRLLDMYARAQLGHPDLAERMAPFVRRHQEHLQALGGKPETPTPTPTSSPTSIDRTTAVTRLSEAEGAAARTRQDYCLRAADGELARLLASIAACEALHQSDVGRL